MTTIPFLPQLGGMEMFVALLAGEFVKLGCEVKVVTATASGQKDSLPYDVIRQPSWKNLRQKFQWADAILLQGLTLRLGWPILLCNKPCLVTHHMILGKKHYCGMIRRALLARSCNVSVSHAVARSLPVPSEVIHNPYDSNIFRNEETQPRSRDLVFVGRLCADKGVDLLISALKLLAEKKLHPSLTIVGAGDDRNAVEAQVRQLGLESQVQFAGAVSKQPLAKILQNHRIMVVPSRCEEGFGIVGLEGIACGCVVIGSSGGGLHEAIGPCGVTFSRGNIQALADSIFQLLDSPDRLEVYRIHAQAHLAKHHPAMVAQYYLKLLAANT